jgi:hypothetical protein
MKTRLDLPRTSDGTHVGSMGTARRIYWVMALVLVAAIGIIGMRWVDSGSAADTGTVTYCVTENGSPAKPMLRTALYTADEKV